MPQKLLKFGTSKLHSLLYIKLDGNTRSVFIHQQLLSSHFLWSPPSPSFKTDPMPEKPLSLVFSFPFLWKPNPFPLPVSHVLPSFVLIYPLPSIMHPHITPFASSNYYLACILFIYCPHWPCTQKPARNKYSQCHSCSWSSRVINACILLWYIAPFTDAYLMLTVLFKNIKFF